jgi:hypothetical protein
LLEEETNFPVVFFISSTSSNFCFRASAMTGPVDSGREDGEGGGPVDIRCKAR